MGVSIVLLIYKISRKLFQNLLQDQINIFLGWDDSKRAIDLIRAYPDSHDFSTPLQMFLDLCLRFHKTKISSLLVIAEIFLQRSQTNFAY